MSDLTAALAKVEGEQAAALRWFHEHAGKAVSWSVIKEHADHGARLVTQPMGRNGAAASPDLERYQEDYGVD
jgi:hypothetical protein